LLCYLPKNGETDLYTAIYWLIGATAADASECSFYTVFVENNARFLAQNSEKNYSLFFRTLFG